MKTKLLFAISILFLIASCSKKSEKEPYSIFKDAEFKTIEDEKINVELNSSRIIFIHSGYKLSSPKYSIQINNETPYEISDSSFVKSESHGWNGEEGLSFEKISISLTFNSPFFSIGDQLKLMSQHSEVDETLILEVK